MVQVFFVLELTKNTALNHNAYRRLSNVCSSENEVK